MIITIEGITCHIPKAAYVHFKTKETETGLVSKATFYNSKNVILGELETTIPLVAENA